MKNGNEWNLGCDIGAGHDYGVNEIIYMINGRAILVATCPDPDDAAYIVRAVNAHDKLMELLRISRKYVSCEIIEDMKEGLSAEIENNLLVSIDEALRLADEPTTG
jgi:hypothetical protein